MERFCEKCLCDPCICTQIVNHSQRQFDIFAAANLIQALKMAPANTAIVSKSGNDGTASVGGGHFLTINGAITAINVASLTGVTIYVFPGTYDETVVIPAGNSLRGLHLNTVTIRKQNVTSSTTLLTMGESSRVEDITLSLTSSSHVTLTGVSFPGTTSQTAKLRTVVLTVDNSTATTTGTSNVYGIRSTGTGVPDNSVSALRASTITVRSAGLGNKRALLVDTAANNFHSRDVNFLVTNAGGSGSYIGVEVNQSGAQASIRLASINAPSADISQTAGTIALSSVDLRNSTANGLSFTTLQQPNTLLWADPGNLPGGATRFYRPGTSAVGSTEIFVRLSQKAVVKAVAIRSITGPGGAVTDTWTVRKNGVDTGLTVTLTGSQTSNVNSTTSVNFAAGDTISLKVVTGGGTATTDTVIQVDIF